MLQDIPTMQYTSVFKADSTVKNVGKSVGKYSRHRDSWFVGFGNGRSEGR